MRQQGHYIRAVSLVGLSSWLNPSGADLASLLPECGVPVAALRNCDMLIPFRGFMALLELIAYRYNASDLGLRWSRQMEPHMPNTGPLLALAHFTPNLREWLHDALAYWAWHTNAFSLELFDPIAIGSEPGVALVRVHSAEPVV